MRAGGDFSRGAFLLAGLLALVSVIPLRAQRGAVLLPNDPRASAHRTALVIGNSAYADAPLVNPLNDAADLARLLQNFAVMTTGACPR